LPAVPTQTSRATADKRASEIAAANALLEERRFLTRPRKRLLSAQEEIGLTLLLRGYPKNSGQTPVTEKELAALPRSDIRRRAYEAMVEHNMGLVFEVRKKYIGQGMEDEDLLHYGVLGLMHAVCKFDPDMGYKFSTYGYQWIRQQMTRAIADFGSAIRIPVHLHEKMHKIAAAEARLRAEGRPTKAADVAVATGLTVTLVEELRSISRVTDSLDRELFEGANLGDAVSYELPSSGPEELLYPQWSRADIEQRLLGKLDTKSADILRRRSGLIDEEPQTLDTIGAVYGVTRERIRQLETKARKRLMEILAEEEQDQSRPQLEPQPAQPSPTTDGGVHSPRGVEATISSSAGLEVAARSLTSQLGRTALIRRAGSHGAHIIQAIAEGRLPGSAASARLRRILTGHE
jgi:RNA polymerase primary sigma factor